MSDKFSVWFAEVKGDAPRKIRSGYSEPAEAADVAESELASNGIGGESYAEIRFNGDSEPHTVIFLMDDDEPPTFGVWNTASALWPIFYPESPYGIMLDGNPFKGDDDDNGGKHKKDENSDKMKLDGEDDEPDEDDDFDEDENDEDEGDEESDDEDESEDKDDADEDDENTDEDSDSEDGDTDENADTDDDADDGEDDAEMPRLNIFAKMRGPKGWRKRAEAEELQERNVFGLKVGVLDPEAEKPGQQERNVVAHVEFIESNETRDHGILKLRLPDSVTLGDFMQTKAGVITVKVPYQEG